MTDPHRNSPDLLCEEILADARRAAEGALRRARDEAAEIIAKAVSEAEASRREHLDRARSEAARQGEMILAAVPVEAGRIRSALLNARLEALREDIRRRLLAREGFDHRATVVALAAEAVRRMAGDAFVIRMPAEDRKQPDGELAAEIANQAGRTPLNLELRGDDSIGAGVLIQDREGRQVWDNRLEARLDRLWPSLLRQIAAQTGLVKAGGA